MTDGDGNTVTLVSTSDPEHGTLETEPDGSWTFTPDADFNGETSFTYTVEADGVQDSGEVTITVNPVNDAPTAGDLSDDHDGGQGSHDHARHVRHRR